LHLNCQSEYWNKGEESDSAKRKKRGKIGTPLGRPKITIEGMKGAWCPSIQGKAKRPRVSAREGERIYS